MLPHRRLVEACRAVLTRVSRCHGEVASSAYCGHHSAFDAVPARLAHCALSLCLELLRVANRTRSALLGARGGKMATCAVLAHFAAHIPLKPAGLALCTCLLAHRQLVEANGAVLTGFRRVHGEAASSAGMGCHRAFDAVSARLTHGARGLPLELL